MIPPEALEVTEACSTRPFLEDVEKKWLAYQLLCAVRDSHAREIYHGDIKTENILVTSWNWLYLTDYSASYKPTRLPEDNPADFSYYFDTSGRRTCYLAPERFLSVTEPDDGRTVTWAMDVFSAGCVIAELFTEAPIFNLSQLFKYRNGEYDPRHSYLNKIQDEDVRELVSHMIQVQPESRYSAEEYLNFWRRKAFPEYFYSFLHQYMGLITDPSSGRSSVHPETSNFAEADDRIDKVFSDFDKISYFLGHENGNGASRSVASTLSSSEDVIPVEIDIPNNRHRASAVGSRPVDDGSLIFLTLVVSSLRHTARATARVRACDLMLAFAERVTDEAKLDRILPYVVALLNDRADGVKIAALRTMTQVLSLIRTVSPVNAYVFTEYIRPRLQQFIGGPGPKASPLARIIYASCLASLAHSTAKILDMVQALRADGSIPTIDPDTEDGVAHDLAYQNSFDVARADLLDHFEAHTKALLTDKHASVRRAFLGSVSSLCVFFGSSRANEVILSHLNTYLNDKDWILKCAFFQTIVGVATFVGGPGLEEFILPLMIQALTDPEEFVVQKVLSSFASLAELGLFQRSKTWEMVDISAKFTMHPNYWIREAAVHFVIASTRYISLADRHCIVRPLIEPYLKTTLLDFSEVSMLDSLKKPLNLAILEMAIVWATKTKTSVFWKPNQKELAFSFATTDPTLAPAASKDLRPNALSKVGKNEEDEQWIKRLRSVGMTSDDEPKLLALREYIWRLAPKRAQAAKDAKISRHEGVVLLKDLQVTPQTVFFETEKRRTKARSKVSHSEHRSTSSRSKAREPGHTITDALLDASTTIDDPLAQRKRSYANARKERIGSMPPLQSDPHETQSGPLNLGTPLSVSHGGSKQPRDRLATTKNNGDQRMHHSDATDLGFSDGTITPTDSIRARSISDRSGVKHKSSAINLLNRRDTNKTAAETSTNVANATGQMEGAFQARPSAALKAEPLSIDRRTEAASPVNGGHTYDGNDPTVMKLLDSLASDNYPRDLIDFGPLVTPANKRHSLKKADTQGSEQPWRPQGVLTATFGEHTAPINRVIPSPDHAFFITGSDDGTVKIWDTLRLERNLAHRSRQTFAHTDGGTVKALCFVENTHTFVSAATDGTVKVVKIDYSYIGESPKYGRPRVMREYQLPTGQYAVWLEHTKTDTSSLLLMVTNTSDIIAIDLKSMIELYTLTNPIHHGTPTCFCVDHKQGWLVLGTSHGVLDLWDLRFQLRLKAWGLAGGASIHRVTNFPFDTRNRRICVAGGTGQTDITIWDLERSECCEVFRAGPNKISDKDSLKLYKAWKVDEDKPDGMLGRFATVADPYGDGSDVPDRGTRAVAFGIDYSDDLKHETSSGFILTGGVDKKLRFWDYTHTPSSMIISGLQAEEPQPKYSTFHQTTSLALHTERASQQGSQGAESSSKARRSSAKQPRNTVISLQQQALLRNHLDVITDVCLLESSVRMTVSVDRMGCIYVFQ